MNPTATRRLRAMAAAKPKNEAPNIDVQGSVATLRIYDAIDSWGEMFGVSAKEFANALDELPEEVEEIRLHINSPGGDSFDGIAILNALRAHPAKVVAIVDGIAASAASFIAAGADEMVMARNSELMIHDAWGLVVGNAEDMHSMADMLDHHSDNIASIYAEKTGTDVAEWRAAMRSETWYSAQEAVDAGLADRIETKKASKTKSQFDLSIFTYAGRENAPAPTLPNTETLPSSEIETPGDEVDQLDPMSILRFRHLVASTRT
jgi:ATP-dependent Clp endopeptidase proteolytic subunit ClpP